MLSRVYSAFPYGLEAKLVEIEVEVEPGLRTFQIIGLPDEAIREATKRVSTALKVSGFQAPHQMNKKITVNLAPAGLKKQGSFFDVAIAVGCLAATGQLALPTPLPLFVGELNLQGMIKPVAGALAIGRLALASGFSHLALPAGNAAEAQLAGESTLIAAQSLAQLVAVLKGDLSSPALSLPSVVFSEALSEYDMRDIKGQEFAKRALEIAAAGGHHLFMVGPPGAGKSILARAFPSLLPPLSKEEGLEVAGILTLQEPLLRNVQSEGITIVRPFRSPHHTASVQALLGGGSPVRPGEVTLAHRGILFLDEFPEFRRDALEGLRQPLEEGKVAVVRSQERFSFPARFQFIGAANPCPCGFAGDSQEPCICTPGALSRYQRKLSGPLIDRVDLFISVPRLTKGEMLQDGEGKEDSLLIRGRVAKARAIQRKRFTSLRLNADIRAQEISTFCRVNKETEAFLGQAIERFRLSMRGYHKVLKVARTIADLQGAANIDISHIAEALQYRRSGS